MPRSIKAHALPREILCGILLQILLGVHAGANATNATSGNSTGAVAPLTTAPSTTPPPNATMPNHFVVLTVTMPYSKVREDTGYNDDLSSVCACSRAHTDSRYASGCRRWKHGQAEFDTAKQDKYKAAMASAARTTADEVGIVSITEKRRRAGSSDVQTRVRLCVRNHSFVLALKCVPVFADHRRRCRGG
jgi:hypothetical protein